MLVLRSKSRPIAPPPKRDPFAGHTRQMLGMAKNRRGPVTLPAVRGLAGDPATKQAFGVRVSAGKRI